MSADAPNPPEGFNYGGKYGYVYQETKSFDDMQNIFEQLHELGLCKTPGKKTPNGNKPIFEFKDKNPENQLIFILANYYQASEMLKNEFKNEVWKQDNKELDIRFAVSSFTGYGLYDNCMIQKEDFIKMVNKE